MSYDPYQKQDVAAQGAVIDQGLQAYMRGVFNTMATGLVVTGGVGFAVANTPALFQMIFGSPILRMLVIFAPMIFLWMGFTPAKLARKSAAELRTSFFIFSAVMGLSFASLFYIFTGASVARTFFITAAAFAGTSIYGYTTKKDLTGASSFLMMGATGIFFALLVNMFLHSTMMQLVVSVIGVFVFTGLTAFEVQRLKETYSYGRGMADANDKLAVLSALTLYMYFINIFQFLLQIMGATDRRN